MDCIICGKTIPEERGYYCLKKDMKVAFCNKHAIKYCGKCEVSKCKAKKK
ncbi:MAG: hypothetical protein GTN76_11500 [Candidatus Aenigmarchaeota archaeon]|nr:hypothetical protein [Candidatus Aenigmarchaeota archaeon]NIQ18053.1 hypothetical protein [Candidatus Aenigmarchaeota archaeon]